jgi:prepilin-type N-terminal cleavage/methylation domain-containing protein
MSCSRHGVSLVEVLISIAVLSIGLLGVAAVIPVAGHEAREATHADRAVEIGQAALAQAQVRELCIGLVNTDGTRPRRNPPQDPSSAYKDERFGYPVGESYAIDPLYVSLASKNSDGITPDQYAAFPYRPTLWHPMLAEEWTRFRRVTTANGGLFDVRQTEELFGWEDLVFADADDNESRPTLLFSTPSAANPAPLAPKVGGKYTWMLTACPSTESVWFVAPDEYTDIRAWGHGDNAYEISAVVFYRRGFDLPTLHDPAEPPPERQVMCRMIGGGFSGGDVRLRVFGDPADSSTWQPVNYLTGLKEGKWLLLSGRWHTVSAYNQYTPTTLWWTQDKGVHKWYRIVAVGDVITDADDNGDGAPDPPFLDVTLQGPDWHSGFCVDLDGDGVAAETVASLFDGIIGVFTHVGRVR